MTMINYKTDIATFADQTATLLTAIHRLDFFRRQTIRTGQTGAQVFSAGRFWILASPFPQPIVAFGFVRLTVLAASLIRTFLAVRAEILARFGKFSKRQGAMTIYANLCVHRLSIAYLDQPCHADVLLGLANA